MALDVCLRDAFA
ncbi:hypothetical protein P0033_003388 [Vibrio cholerae]|uniref:Uncharacterized protein n=1 Tax=Vibrio cholerae TaxID=666 RepID=A0ABD7SLV7_VIBCL|nr:hypothetical protein [Vibrio cholerae]MCO7017818.1 hypothetical protein [Vibrio paracholerae]EGQ7971059.1 hypothetical protein [Vibrio cholerae]EGQ7979734.1 hypothetical protein [Vibrio cholerae]EGQ8531383.1 hypothetical protein [Vibrio cholerae]